jgi:hypothetical protein
MRILAGPKLITAGLALAVSACATIVSDEYYMVSFNSSPQEAEATISNERGLPVHRGQTPFSVVLKAPNGYFNGMDYSVLFKKKCYQEVVTPLEANLDEWYWGNILFGGLIGFLLVDSAGGAMWELEESVMVALTPSGEPECRPASD